MSRQNEAWAIVGLGYQGQVDDADKPVYDGTLYVLLHHNPLGTESVELESPALPTGTWTTSSWDELCGMVNSLIRHDQRLYPPFNPLPAVLDGTRITTLLVHEDEGDDLGLVAKAAARYDLPLGTGR